MHTFSDEAKLAKFEPVPDEDEWVVDARVETAQHAMGECVSTVREVGGVREDVLLDGRAGAFLL